MAKFEVYQIGKDNKFRFPLKEGNGKLVLSREGYSSPAACLKRSFIAITLLLSFFSIATFGQVTEGEKTLRTVSADTTQGWKGGGVFAVNLAQTSLTNWVSGGQNSVAINGVLSVFANMIKGKSRWDNSLDLGYGLLKQGKEDFRKTDDKIDFLSK
mgnify:CR=1 FL=1